MATISKFYMHAAASGLSNIPTDTHSATTPTVDALPTNGFKSMDSSVGSAQTSTAITTLNNQSLQSAAFIGFVSQPIAAQTISAQSMNVSFGCSISNTNSNPTFAYVLYVWRPSTQALVGRIVDLTSTFLGLNSTAEFAATCGTTTGLAVTAQDGDYLVIELWRGSSAQTMSTAYTNTVYYDGTTDNSTTSNAAYVLFTNAVTMYSPAVYPEPLRIVGNSAAIQRANNW